LIEAEAQFAERLIEIQVYVVTNINKPIVWQSQDTKKRTKILK